MTDTEINIAIAEACGWEKQVRAEAWWNPQKGKYATVNELPSYTTDLNAMHEAEKVLKSDDRKMWEYVRQLVATTHGRMYPDCISSWTLSHATDRQRAEAFLRTIGKWKE